MSTNSVLGYFDNENKFRGTTIIYDGMTVGAEANALLQARGEKWLLRWVEAGIRGGGYRSCTEREKPYKDSKDGEPVGLGEYFDNGWLEYGWVITDKGVKPLETHLYEQKRRDIGFWECWTTAEKLVKATHGSQHENNDVVFAAGRIARERFSEDSVVLPYIVSRLTALMSR